MSGYVRVYPGSFKPQRRFSAQKHIMAVMPEVCLGMSVVCPGMSGFILNPKASKRTKQILAGMLEVCLGMSVVCPGMSG